MSHEKPRPRVRSWGFSLCGLVVGVDALGAEIGVQVGSVIRDAPPDADKRRPAIAVPPLRQFLDAPEDAHFRVFREEHAVIIKDASVVCLVVCHRLSPVLDGC